MMTVPWWALLGFGFAMFLGGILIGWYIEHEIGRPR